MTSLSAITEEFKPQLYEHETRIMDINRNKSERQRLLRQIVCDKIVDLDLDNARRVCTDAGFALNVRDPNIMYNSIFCLQKINCYTEEYRVKKVC